MKLTDTNVFIDFWKNQDEASRKVFESCEIAVCGVIYTELLTGCRSQEQKQKILSVLSGCKYFSFTKDDWTGFADFLKKLKDEGVSVPFQDGVIAWLAIKNNCEVWSRDKHFVVMKAVFPELKVFSV